jgi:hypothetical protein
MPIVKAYQCPHTKALFLQKEEYRRHLVRLARERRIERQRLTSLRDVDAEFAEMRKLPRLTDVAAWIGAHPTFLAKNATVRRGWEPVLLKRSGVKRVVFSEMRFVSEIYNTHYCPLDGVENWSRDPQKLLFYPGWTGRVAYVLDLPRFFSTDLFEGTGIHIGNGGGDGQQYTYYCTLFVQDWRGLAATAICNKAAGTSLDDII